VVGDGDSLGEDGLARLRAAGIAVELAPVAKDESDTELAVLAAVRRGAARLTILGALGGPRLDHALANVWLLAHPALAGIDAVILDDRCRLRLLAAPAMVDLPGRHGDLVSLLPFGGDALGVTTDGLAYPLAGEPLRMGPARGLSNVMTRASASVSLRAGRLLIIQTHTGRGESA
jgi:thiamine pyrophosphokinase